MKQNSKQLKSSLLETQFVDSLYNKNKVGNEQHQF